MNFKFKLWIAIAICFLLLIGCQPRETIKEENNTTKEAIDSKTEYILVKDPIVPYAHPVEIEELDGDFHSIKTGNTYQATHDLGFDSFSEIAQKTFICGPGGFLSVSWKTGECDFIEGQDINDVDVYKGNTWVYINEGRKEGEEEYVGIFKNLDEEVEYVLPGSVGEFVWKDDNTIIMDFMGLSSEMRGVGGLCSYDIRDGEINELGYYIYNLTKFNDEIYGIEHVNDKAVGDLIAITKGIRYALGADSRNKMDENIGSSENIFAFGDKMYVVFQESNPKKSTLFEIRIKDNEYELDQVLSYNTRTNFIPSGLNCLTIWQHDKTMLYNLEKNKVIWEKEITEDISNPYRLMIKMN